MSKKQKILYVQHSGANGGAPMSLFYLLEYVRKDYEVTVYFIVDGPAVKKYRDAGITAVIEPGLGKLPHCTIEYQSLNPLKLQFYIDLKKYAKCYLKLIPTYFKMCAVLKKEQPDIVHLNSSVLLAEGLAVASSKVPLVWHMRDFIEQGNFGLRMKVVRKVISNSADVVIGLCQAELDRVGTVRRGVVIPNFVNLDKFNRDNIEVIQLRKKLGLDENAQIIAMLGWHIPSKGALVLLKAFLLLKDKFPQLTIVFFGTGTQTNSNKTFKNKLRNMLGEKSIRGELEDIIIENGIQQRTIFPGVIQDVASHIAEVDLIAAPFTSPHFARPILEAGALKVPVITSDIDGTREMVLNGRAGYLVSPSDTADLAKGIEQSLLNNNDDKIYRMYENVKSNYNGDINSKKNITIYQKLLSNNLLP